MSLIEKFTLDEIEEEILEPINIPKYNTQIKIQKGGGDSDVKNKIIDEIQNANKSNNSDEEIIDPSPNNNSDEEIIDPSSASNNNSDEEIIDPSPNNNSDEEIIDPSPNNNSDEDEDDESIANKKSEERPENTSDNSEYEIEDEDIVIDNKAQIFITDEFIIPEEKIISNELDQEEDIINEMMKLSFNKNIKNTIDNFQKLKHHHSIKKDSEIVGYRITIQSYR